VIEKDEEKRKKNSSSSLTTNTLAILQPAARNRKNTYATNLELTIFT